MADGRAAAVHEHAHVPYAKMSERSGGATAKRWLVTEKVHGANFAIGVDVATRRVRFHKRKAALAPGGDTGGPYWRFVGGPF